MEMIKQIIYRCGWCGIRVSSSGRVLEESEIDDTLDWDSAEPTNGECCHANDKANH